MTQHGRMLLGIGLGSTLGLASNVFFAQSTHLAWVVSNVAHPVGQIFLRLLFMLVVPLLFSALVMGVGDLDVRHLGKLGLRTLAYTACVSVIAVAIGLVFVNVFQPGANVSESVRAMATASSIKPPPAPDTTGVGLLIAIVPDNPIRAAANGDMIGLIFFSLLFGIGISLTRNTATEHLQQAIAGLYEVCMRLITGVLRLAPIGVGALLFTICAKLGLPILKQLAAYVAVVVGALALHMFGVYSLSVKVLGGRSPIGFFRDVRVAIITAFSTASSNATLPTALKVAEENLKLPHHVSRFVLTAGATLNQNGTALFEGVTVLFLAQVYGVHLGVAEQLGVMGICVLGGIGTAGVPAGSIPVVIMILGMYGIPVEGIGLVLGVDRFLDMCRTVLNVTGDLAAAVVVSRGEPSEILEPALAGNQPVLSQNDHFRS